MDEKTRDKPTEVTREDLDSAVYKMLNPKMYRLIDSVTGKDRGYIADFGRYNPEFQRFREKNPTVELVELDKNWKIKERKR